MKEGIDVDTRFLWLALIGGYIVAVAVGLFALIIVYNIYTGKINIEKMLCEKNGDASLSRFQFLIFTFVIAMSLLLLVIANLSKGTITFPGVPAGVWALLGISGGSYTVSKGIQKKAETEAEKGTTGKPGWPTS